MRQPKNSLLPKANNADLISDLLRALEHTSKNQFPPSTTRTDAFQPLGRQISEILEVKNLLYGALQLPLDLRNFLDAVMAVSKGSIKWFEYPDLKLAAQLFGDPEEDGNSIGALKKRIQRLRKKLMEWQMKKNLRLVDVDPGHSKYGRDQQGNVDTSYLERNATTYRLPILPVLEATLRDCISGQRNNSAEILKFLIERHVNDLAGKPVYPDSGGYTDLNKQSARLKGQGISAIVRCLQQCQENGGQLVMLRDEIITRIKIETQNLLASEIAPTQKTG